MTHISELDTPALLIDLDILERNLARVAGYAREHGLRLRPHTKTHKVPAIGKMQLESGAVGLTVAKVGEAEVMLGSGAPDLLVNYPVIGRSKLKRLAEVARKARVTVALDSDIAARQLSEAATEARSQLRRAGRSRRRPGPRRSDPGQGAPGPGADHRTAARA